MRHLLVLFWCLVCSGFNWCYAEQDISKNGTLIVVYETDSKGDRLDRVRFWLRDEDHNQRMYPKEGSFVEDRRNMSRTVVIEDLSPGIYRLDFLIPNKDASYEDSEQNSIEIRPGEVTKIDHHFKLRDVAFYDSTTQRDWLAWLTFLSNAADEVGQRFTRRFPRPREMGLTGGLLNVETNLPDSEWILYHDDTVSYHGSGSVSNLIIPAGQGYLIRANPVEGYSVKVYPVGRFRIGKRQSFVARIFYERSFGKIELNATTPQDEAIGIKITSDTQTAPIQLDLIPQNGRIRWESGNLPTGNYTIIFQTPPTLTAPSPITITLHEDELVQLAPDFSNERNLTVTSNTEDAIYLLQDERSDKKWQGQGIKYTFKGIVAGDYVLSFTSRDPDFLKAPDPQKIRIEQEPEEVKVTYQITGKLNIETNLDKAQVTIISQSNPAPTIKDLMEGNKKGYQLQPGVYHIVIEQIGGNKQQKNQEVTLNAYETKNIQANFSEPVSKINRQEQAQLIIISNQMDAKFKILKKQDKEQKVIGTYQGKYVSVSLEPKIEYELIFEPLENYNQPQPLLFELQPGEHRIARFDFIPSEVLLQVPEGKVFLGDHFSEGEADETPSITASISAFLIGKYEVTNALYAAWLTKAVREGKLIYLSDFDNKGQVIDLEGHLICKTMASDPYSQISATEDSESGTQFRAILGKDNYPVINVTWYGAQSYAKDHNCRLPTEAEWEKAAAMTSDEKGEKWKKYRYGFSADEIDKKWANFKYDPKPITNFQVLTTEVGFYNGVNLLHLSGSDSAQLKTQDARSPVGAYDMSGNVFEWVSDWYTAKRSSSDLKNPKGPTSGEKKIVKGGCYDSLAEELRVSKRLPLPPEHCDPYTGFRVAKNQ